MTCTGREVIDRPRSASERLVFAVAVVLTVGDAALTYVAVTVGPAAEANPWLAALIDAIGAGPAMAVRAAVGVALLVVLWVLAAGHRSARGGLIVAAAALGAVAVYHLLAYRAFLP